MKRARLFDPPAPRPGDYERLALAAAVPLEHVTAAYDGEPTDASTFVSVTRAAADLGVRGPGVAPPRRRWR